LPEYVEPIESPFSKPGSDDPLVLTVFRSINDCDQQPMRRHVCGWWKETYGR
jgi:hypothetical protein